MEGLERRSPAYRWTRQSIQDMIQYMSWSIAQLARELEIGRVDTVYDWLSHDIRPSYINRQKLTLVSKKVKYPYLDRFNPRTGLPLHME